MDFKTVHTKQEIVAADYAFLPSVPKERTDLSQAASQSFNLPGSLNEDLHSGRDCNAMVDSWVLIVYRMPFARMVSGSMFKLQLPHNECSSWRSS